MKKHLITFLVALMGAFAGSAIYHSRPALAAGEEGLWVHGPDGRDRIQIGAYNSGAERGLPLVGLFDNHSRLRMLLRLAGGNESPVLIFKDKSGRDRLVMGLGLNGAEEPFLSTVDGAGRKTNVFGNY